MGVTSRNSARQQRAVENTMVGKTERDVRATSEAGPREIEMRLQEVRRNERRIGTAEESDGSMGVSPTNHIQNGTGRGKRGGEGRRQGNGKQNESKKEATGIRKPYWFILSRRVEQEHGRKVEALLQHMVRKQHETDWKEHKGDRGGSNRMGQRRADDSKKHANKRRKNDPRGNIQEQIPEPKSEHVQGDQARDERRMEHGTQRRTQLPAKRRIRDTRIHYTQHNPKGEGSSKAR